MMVKNYLYNVLWKLLIKLESTWRHEIKEQTLQLTLLYCGRLVRSSHWRFSIKRAVFNNFTIFTGTPQLGSLFGLEAFNFVKKRPQHRCFLVNNIKFLRLLISKIVSKWLLFDSFNASLLHGPKVSRPRLYDSIRLQGLGHRSSFLFLKSAESWRAFENLRQIPLMSQLSFYIGYFWSF